LNEIIRESDRAAFKRCRRAWDLGSRSRQNFEPVAPLQMFDVDRAIHDALALWYFPGMWEWSRDIVAPLAMQGFEKAMVRQRAAYGMHREISDTEEAAWRGSFERGQQLLQAYFRWAPGADAFSPVRVDSDFDANVPDPSAPGSDLVAPRGPIHYQGRIDALVVDAYDAYWIIDHRVVDGHWEDQDQLLLDERGIAACWAWEIFYYGMKIAGTIYNELRIDLPAPEPLPVADVSDAGAPAGGAPAAGRPGVLPGYRRMYLQAAHVPEDRLEVTGTDAFRRTRVTRRRAELAGCGMQVATEAKEMTREGLAVYPNPTPDHCTPCAYRAPCLALNSGLDPSGILAEAYRDRGPDEPEEGRLGGSTWSMNRGARPPSFGGS
jgi:hypothetical protein